MLILDTDHLTALDRKNAAGGRLERLLDSRRSEVCTTIVSVSEQLGGLQALIASSAQDAALLENYGRLARKLDDIAEFVVLALTTDALAEFKRLRQARICIGTMDLRIASIALTHKATLLSANLRDFAKIPGLRVENWLT